MVWGGHGRRWCPRHDCTLGSCALRGRGAPQLCTAFIALPLEPPGRILHSRPMRAALDVCIGRILVAKKAKELTAPHLAP